MNDPRTKDQQQMDAVVAAFMTDSAANAAKIESMNQPLADHYGQFALDRFRYGFFGAVLRRIFKWP
jgi:hypothetical protein